jgi:hypothetical protein
LGASARAAVATGVKIEEERKMRKLLVGSSILCLALGVLITLAGTSLAAVTHVIVGTQRLTWTYNGQTSTTNGKALIVDDLKIGDIIEIQIPTGRIPHGFITLKKDADVETKDLVWTCENKTKPDGAVLRQKGCESPPVPKFGEEFTGSMQLEVMDTFKDDINFWCVIHNAAMRGTLKLKQ